MCQAYGSAAADPVTFLAQRKVTKRCGPMACRPHVEAVRVRKHWPGSAEVTSCAAAEDAQSISRPAGGFSVQYLPTGAGAWIKRNFNRGEAAALRSALRCVLLSFIPIRGGEVAQESPQGGRMDLASSLQVPRMRLQRTPLPACVVVRLLRTTDPLRRYLWAMFLCEQKGGSAGVSPAKLLTSWTRANHSV